MASCLGTAGSHVFQHRRCEGTTWLVVGAGVTPAREVGLFHRTLLVSKVQRAHSWKKTLLRAINNNDCLAPRKCLGSSSCCGSGAHRISLQAYLLLQPSFISCCQKTGPRAMTSALVQLCHCYMVSLGHCSSAEIEADGWRGSRVLPAEGAGKVFGIGGHCGAGGEERLKSEFVCSGKEEP